MAKKSTKKTKVKKAAKKGKGGAGGKAASAASLIDARIKELGDWRGETLALVRAIIAHVPGVVEEWKWNVPVWSHGGIICTGETYKSVMKLTFAKGASLADPSGLFNSSLEGKTRRAIDIREGEKVDARALKALVREALKANATEPAASRSTAAGRARKKAKKA